MPFGLQSRVTGAACQQVANKEYLLTDHLLCVDGMVLGTEGRRVYGEPGMSELSETSQAFLPERGKRRSCVHAEGFSIRDLARGKTI